MNSRPNILVVITDHQRFDSLDMVQGGREVMPRLNQFSRDAMVFTRAYTTSPLCIPARTAMATGHYPTRGIPINDFSGKEAREQSLATVYLEQAGYHVGYIGKNDIRVRPTGRDQHPHSTWLDKEDYEAWLQAEGLPAHPGWEGREAAFLDYYYKDVEEVLPDRVNPSRYSHPATGTWEGSKASFRDYYFTDQMETWLESAIKSNQPFAAFFSIPSPHPPLVVPEPFNSWYTPETLELPPYLGQPAEGEPANRDRSVARQLARSASELDMRNAWAAHLALLGVADDCFGRVLDKLEALGLDDNTLVLFTSDHGHHLGSHRMFGINELYEQTVHVPMIARLPGGHSGSHGGLCSHLDVAPTLLDLAGLEVPDAMDGRSLVPLLSGEATLPDEPQYFQFSGQIGYGYFRRGVVTQRYKYVFDPEDIPEFYDLEKDPFEMNNLSMDPDSAKAMTQHHEWCKAWHLAHGDWLDFDRNAR